MLHPTNPHKNLVWSVYRRETLLSWVLQGNKVQFLSYLRQQPSPEPFLGWSKMGMTNHITFSWPNAVLRPTISHTNLVRSVSMRNSSWLRSSGANRVEYLDYFDNSLVQNHLGMGRVHHTPPCRSWRLTNHIPFNWTNVELHPETSKTNLVQSVHIPENSQCLSPGRQQSGILGLCLIKVRCAPYLGWGKMEDH